MKTISKLVETKKTSIEFMPFMKRLKVKGEHRLYLETNDKITTQEMTPNYEETIKGFFNIIKYLMNRRYQRL